jgi:NADPH:quinone reductase-like Zn-dependent oxidoreductase
MNAVYFNTRGGPEALVYGSATMPGAGEGEIVVRVRAAAVTPTELLWVPTWTTRAGKPRPFPIIPGHEFSGEVHALGSGVNDVAVGDAVFGVTTGLATARRRSSVSPAARMSRRSRRRSTT